MAEPAPELKTYHGNCHCGAFAYSVKLPELKSVSECNCSICHRKGYKWVFPGVGCFTVEKDEGKMKDYEFGPRNMAHRFCSVCGTGVYGMRYHAAPGSDLGLNVRTLRDVDVLSLPVRNIFNGKALSTTYVPSKYEGPEPDAILKNAKIYTGGCHCGAVTMAMKIHGSLSDGKEEIISCNCSICSRNAEIWLYLKPSQITIPNSSILTCYIFGQKMQSHEFCPVCGVSVFIQKFNLPPAVFHKWEPEMDQEEWKDAMPINLRCFEDVEWDKIVVGKHDGRNAGPVYGYSA